MEEHAWKNTLGIQNQLESKHMESHAWNRTHGIAHMESHTWNDIQQFNESLTYACKHAQPTRTNVLASIFALT